MSDEPQPGPSWEHEREADSSSDDHELLELAEQISDGESDLDLHFEPSASKSDKSSSLEDERPAETWSKRTTPPTVAPFTEIIGVQHSLPADAEPVDFFQLFFDDALFAEIAKQTNLYAEARQRESGKRDRHWAEPTTASEIKLFFTANIMMGIVRLPRIRNYWANDSRLNVSAVSSLMSRNRFEAISRYIHLTEREAEQTGGGRGQHPLHKVHPLIEQLQRKFPAHYKPGKEISIDEAMVKFKGRVHIKQYIRGKPTPWGIKVWCAADPRTGYLLDFDVYVGKRDTSVKGKSLFLFLLQNLYFDIVIE